MCKGFRNVACNPEMELDMILNGVVLKACDFDDDSDGVKVMVRELAIPRSEKIRREALYRVKLTGKKHDRIRKDYKDAKRQTSDRRDYRLYGAGSYDRRGNWKVRRDADRVADALKNEVADHEHLVAEAERSERVRKEILERTRKSVEAMRAQAAELKKAFELIVEKADRLEASLKNLDEEFVG